VTSRPKILVTNRVHEEVVQRLAALGDVSVNSSDAPFARAELLRRAGHADAILAFMNDSIDAEFISACPRLKIVACALKGADNFDAEACTAAGVWLSLVPDLLTEPTAELAVGLAIALGRELRAGDTLVRTGAFEGWRPVLYGVGLDRSTVAIVGMGAVGKAIARRIAGFGSRILGVDPLALPPPGVERAELGPALAAADFVILAVPLSAATRHMIGTAALAAIRPGALLVNVGRGSVVDETAVLAALEAGTLGGYAADVFEFEDWAWAGRPAEVPVALRTHPRTFFTPHLGSAVDRVRREIAMRAADNIADVLTGRPARDAANRPRIGTLPLTG
jgi:phosphonate dehydrogenase